MTVLIEYSCQLKGQNRLLLIKCFSLCFAALQSYYLGMSLQNMNQMRLVPKKDYVANRLVSGALQLARNTSLFLDETQLEQGQLDTTGEASGNQKGTTLRLGLCSYCPLCLQTLLPA